MSKQKYMVHITIDATSWVTISTENVEKAIELALRRCGRSLCGQCAANIELGEPYKVTVTDEHGNELETREV